MESRGWIRLVWISDGHFDCRVVDAGGIERLMERMGRAWVGWVGFCYIEVGG